VQGSQETRVMGLSERRKSFRIGLAVLIQYRSVTASHPASHVPVAITLNAKASSLKMAVKMERVIHIKLFILECFVDVSRCITGMIKPLFKQSPEFFIARPSRDLPSPTVLRAGKTENESNASVAFLSCFHTVGQVTGRSSSL